MNSDVSLHYKNDVPKCMRETDLFLSFIFNDKFIFKFSNKSGFFRISL